VISGDTDARVVQAVQAEAPARLLDDLG